MKLSLNLMIGCSLAIFLSAVAQGKEITSGKNLRTELNKLIGEAAVHEQKEAAVPTELQAIGANDRCSMALPLANSATGYGYTSRERLR